ncbi:MAG: DNA mismatch repair endonuclease MutL [Clostridia bacterium]|nr:DNA mismatch repair endonuclease MutL [Clostridia bacterium]
MGKIIVLDENTSNKIAAGEVIERPSSVVKELVENSIDAGASAITVEIKNGGISFIKVTDNGSGIDEDDIEIAFERHATSKIKSARDLESIATLGFRGEALSSIAAVSTVELTTRVEKNNHGTYIKVQGGSVKEVRQTGCPVGSTFIVRDLFYNTPARYKFLKKDSTEAGYVSDVLSRIALGNPSISIKLLSNSAVVFHSPGNNDLLSAIFSIYGKEIARDVLAVSYSDEKMSLSGFVGKADIARSNRTNQSIFINGRYIKSKLISSAVDEAYKTLLMKSRFPFFVLNLDINPQLVDVNVHPTKMEVRFSQEQEIFMGVYHAVENSLISSSLIKEMRLEDEKEDGFRFKNTAINKPDYSQEEIAVSSISVSEYPETQYTPQSKTSYNIQDSIEAAEETKYPEPSYSMNNYTCIENNAGGIETPKKYNSFAEYMIVGQAFSTYIILQKAEELVLIDQHAAHERIMYERLKKKYENKVKISQNLIVPLVVNMTYKEIKFLEENKDFFISLGFEFENFGNNSVIIRAVPLLDENDAIKSTFLEVIDALINSNKTINSITADETLYSIACKAAVKANKRLDDSEIRSLLEELDFLENPYTCPHGRPTAIRLTKHELEKMFKRII